MKLILAILRDEDTEAVSQGLIVAGFPRDTHCFHRWFLAQRLYHLYGRR